MPRIHLDRLPQLARRLQRFVRKVRKRLPVEQVILHGSAARGDLTESSDIDLVLIGDFRERWLDRLRRVGELVPEYLPADVFCYTRQEYNDGLKRGNAFLHEVLKWGRPLTGDEPLELRHRGQDREERYKRMRGVQRAKPITGRSRVQD